jgi:hypothetical protein
MEAIIKSLFKTMYAGGLVSGAVRVMGTIMANASMLARHSKKSTRVAELLSTYHGHKSIEKSILT